MTFLIFLFDISILLGEQIDVCHVNLSQKNLHKIDTYVKADNSFYNNGFRCRVIHLWYT